MNASDIRHGGVPCGYCDGSGVQPSPEMVETVQRALDRGTLNINELDSVVEALRGQTPTDFDALDAAARRAYAAHCACDPIEPREPDWGRGGYKTEVAVWQAVARAVLSAPYPPNTSERPG